MAPSISYGGDLSLADDLDGGLVRHLAARVAATPNGLIRSLGVDGIERQVSYKTAWERSGRIAARLPDKGDGERPPVVILVKDAVDFVPAFWACLRAGRVFTALPSVTEAAKHPQDALALRKLFRKLGKPLLLIDEHFEHSPLIGDLFRKYRTLPLSVADRRAPPWDDGLERPAPLCLVATSGSTGSLKLAMLDEQVLLHRYFATGDPRPSVGTNALGLLPFDSITGLRLAFLQYATFTHVPSRVVPVRPAAILDAIGASPVARWGRSDGDPRSSLLAG